MSSSRNQFEFIGNLGKSPEIIKLENGRDMCRLFVICNQSWKDKETGEKKERSEGFGVVVFGNHAKYLSSYAYKGDKVLLKGEIRNNSWTDKTTGEEKSGFEFVVSGYGSDAMIFGKQIKDDAFTG